MHLEYNLNGMSDFICTNAVQYLIRDEELHAVVQMRSNDAWAGYRNDYGWQLHVLQQLAKDLKIGTGKIHWNVGSLHLYQSQFYLLDHYIMTDEHAITLPEYKKLYNKCKA
jgi:thymidylate synthase